MVSRRQLWAVVLSVHVRPQFEYPVVAGGHGDVIGPTQLRRFRLFRWRWLFGRGIRWWRRGRILGWLPCNAPEGPASPDVRVFVQGLWLRGNPYAPQPVAGSRTRERYAETPPKLRCQQCLCWPFAIAGPQNRSSGLVQSGHLRES